MKEQVLLDELDRRILNQLQQDASLSNIALARLVHASAPTCLRRVKRLHALGVIEKQLVIVSPAKVGGGLDVIVEISLDRQTAEDYNAFEALVQKAAEVLQCYRVSAGSDFVLILQLADMAAYHDLVHCLFTTATNVRNVRAFFSMHRSKFETRIVL